MSEQTGEKTERPTPKKLEEALKKGQIARSPEVQTACVLLGGFAAFSFTGHEMWRQLVNTTSSCLSHLHDTQISTSSLQGQSASGVLLFMQIVGPIVIGTMLCGVLASAVQNRFNISSEALDVNWERLNPVEGFKRTFSFQNTVPTLVSIVKLAVVISLTYSEVKTILNDPIFSSSVSLGRMGGFLAEVTFRLTIRVTMALVVVAAADYGYQFWKNSRDMMMTKDEVKEEMKSSEGNPQMKAARRRKRATSKAKQLAEVIKADVVVTNPTHIAIALRYDRKTMRAPKVVAKGIRLNAQKIREIAQRHQVPIMENKPLARMLFKHARVGGEVPAQFFTAVAEVLAWVYRVNRYRYYSEKNQA